MLIEMAWMTFLWVADSDNRQNCLFRIPTAPSLQIRWNMGRVMKKIWVLFFSISTVMDLLISMSEVEEVNSGRDRNTTATGSILEMAKGCSPYRAEFCRSEEHTSELQSRGQL